MPKKERREQILAAACALFAEQGYNGATISEIVSRCGVAQGTFYLYFKSKRDVFAALLEQLAAAVYEVFIVPPTGEVRTQADVKARFEHIARQALVLFQEHQDLVRIVLIKAPTGPSGFADQAAALRSRLVAGSAANLQEWMAGGLLRRADPVVIAHCVIGMIERLAIQRLNGTLEADLEAAAREVIEFELRGILRDPAEVFGE